MICSEKKEYKVESLSLLSFNCFEDFIFKADFNY